MSARPWYACYPADYANKTGHLSMIEHGAYRLLLDHYYSTSKPLPTDVERMLRLCRAGSEVEKAAVLSVLREFFFEEPDGWHNKRADDEIEKAAEVRAKCVKAGLASAHKRQQEENIEGNNPPNNEANMSANKTPNIEPNLPHPHPHPGKNRETKTVSFANGKSGKWETGTTTIKDQAERLARFQAKIATHLGPPGWAIVASAADTADPQHDANIALCKQAARDISKGWPRGWK